jgi:hypothetical protein
MRTYTCFRGPLTLDAFKPNVYIVEGKLQDAIRLARNEYNLLLGPSQGWGCIETDAKSIHDVPFEAQGDVSSRLQNREWRIREIQKGEVWVAEYRRTEDKEWSYALRSETRYCADAYILGRQGEPLPQDWEKFCMSLTREMGTKQAHSLGLAERGNPA